MDASEKIITFESLDDLKRAIDQDISAKDVLPQRYCVRFIMLNNFEVFRELSKHLTKEMGVDFLDIEDLTLGEDKTVTMERLSEAIANVTKPTLITPFSEVVRFFKEDDFRGFFNDIMLTERLKHPGLRIYVPIIGLRNRFVDFLKNFARIEESAPIWQYNTEEDDRVQVYVMNFPIPAIAEELDICHLQTMHDWLRFWKRLAPRKKIICGAGPIARGYKNSKPDSIFTFIEIKDGHEFLTGFLNINIPIEYKEEEAEFWNEILKSIDKEDMTGFDFRAFVGHHFNRLSLSFNDLLQFWAEEKRTAYERWLLKHYATTQGVVSDPYLKLCLEETTEIGIANALFIHIAERIFYVQKANEREAYYEGRREAMRRNRDLFARMVSMEHQNWICDKIIATAQTDNKLSVAKKYCVGTFPFERLLFIAWYAIRTNNDFELEHMAQFYPELHAYLQPMTGNDIDSKQKWCEEYFRAFKEAKVKDEYLPALQTLLSEKNKDEDQFYNWYYGFEESHQLLQKAEREFDVNKTYWVDGLGAEFLPYICHLVKSGGDRYEILQAEVARTTIPSNTHLNCFGMECPDVYKFGKLDELAHGNLYKKYETLRDELETIKQIVTQIINENRVGNHTFALVSDHGLTPFSRLCDSRKMDANAKHEGRYVELGGEAKIVSEADFIVHTNEKDGKKYKIALTHSSLGKRPTHEAHGGCTPEEVLVPFVVISNIDSAKPLNYRVSLLENKIPMTDPTIKVSIIPEPQSATLSIDGKTIDMTNDKTVWSATLGHLKEGKHHVNIKPYKGKSQSFDIEVYGLGFWGGLPIDDF